MKVLYFFPEYGNPMFSWQRIHIIDELERNGVSVKTFNPLKRNTPEEANEQFIQIMKQGDYDLLMSSVCYPGIIYPEVLEVAHQQGIPSLGVRWDNLTIPFFDEKQANKFDLLWLTASETTYLYDKWRANYIVLPYAANPHTFTPVAGKLNRKVCFIGNPHGSRALMINTLTKNDVPVEVYHGAGKKVSAPQIDLHCNYDIINPSTSETLVNRLRFREGRKLILGSIVNKLKGKTTVEDNERLKKCPGLSHKDMVMTYSAASLSLASTSAGHTDVLKNPLPIINLRNFEIPMCGGIEICKYNKELASYFEEGKEIVFYSSEEELVDKARYYTQKATDKEIFTIKEAARKRAENEHTWWNRFVIAFAKLGLKYE